MDLNPAFDYASRNFSNIKRDLLRRARVVAPTWTDRDPSDFGMMFVDLWSYMGDVIHFYIDRASKEAFIQTATQRESVLAFANLYDYRPNFRTAAEAIVYVANTTGASVTLPANTRFRVIHNDVYYTLHTPADITIPELETSAVPVFEGNRVDEEVLTASAPGSPNQKYVLRAQDVVPSTIRVFVYIGGERSEWIRYNSVGSIPSGVPGFVVNVNPEEEIEILFGDRSSGRTPPSGTLITISYTVSSGEEGNLPENSFIVFDGSPSNGLIIQGMSASVGGSDGESVESIRSALQSIIRTQDRAVTLEDYRDLALTVNGVYNSVASFELTPVDPVFPNNMVTIYPLPFVSDYLNFSDFEIPVPEEMRYSILDVLEPRSTLGVYVHVVDYISVLEVNITADVLIKANYVNRWVKEDIENALNALLTFDAVGFGKPIYTSDIYRAIINIEGVEVIEDAFLEMRDFANALVEPLDMSPVELIRKGTFTIDVFGGIDTSI